MGYLKMKRLNRHDTVVSFVCTASSVGQAVTPSDATFTKVSRRSGVRSMERISSTPSLRGRQNEQQSVCSGWPLQKPAQLRCAAVKMATSGLSSVSRKLPHAVSFKTSTCALVVRQITHSTLEMVSAWTYNCIYTWDAASGYRVRASGLALAVSTYARANGKSNFNTIHLKADE